MKKKSVDAAGHPNWDWPSYAEFLVEFKSLDITNLKPFDQLANMPNRRTLENHYKKTWVEMKKDAGLAYYPNLLNDAELINYIQKAFDKDGASISTLKSYQLTYDYLTKRFGSVEKVYELAGYELKSHTFSDKSSADLLEDYLKLSKSLGKAATVIDLNNSTTTDNFSIYENRFGNLNHVRELVGLPADPRNLKQHSRTELIEKLGAAFDNNPNIKYDDLRRNLEAQHISMTTLRRYFGSAKKDDLYGLKNRTWEIYMEIKDLNTKIQDPIDIFAKGLHNITIKNYVSYLKKIGFRHKHYSVNKIVATAASKSNIPKSIPKTTGLYVFSFRSPQQATEFTEKYRKFKNTNDSICLPNLNDNTSTTKSNFIYLGSSINLQSRLTAHLNLPNEKATTYALHLGKFKAVSNFSLSNMTLDIFYFDDKIAEHTRLAIKALTEQYLHNELNPRIGNIR